MKSRHASQLIALVLSLSMFLGSVPLAAFAEPEVPNSEESASELVLGNEEAASAEDVTKPSDESAAEEDAPDSLGEPSAVEPLAEEPAESDDENSTNDASISEAEQPSDTQELPDAAQLDDEQPSENTDDQVADELATDEDAEEGNPELAPELASTSGNWLYTELEDTSTNGTTVKRLYICGYTGTAKNITIPTTLNGKTVYGLCYDSASNRWPVEKVTIPKSLKVINNFAFQGASTLKEIAFESGSTLTTIGESAFSYTGLTSFTMPTSLESLGIRAFEYCDKLTQVTFNTKLDPCYNEVQLLGMGLEKRYYNAFDYAPNVKFNVPTGSKNYKVVDNILFSKDGTILYCYPTGRTASSFSIASPVKYVASYSFAGVKNLKQASIASSVKEIGSYAFYESGLTSVKIPNSVTKLGDQCFAYCYDLSTATIGTGVKDLWLDGTTREQFFRSGLTSVTLPETLTQISNACFASTNLTSVDIPASVHTLNYGAFGDIFSLSKVTGGEGLTHIYPLAFRNATISSFPFGKKLSFVSGTAFAACEKYPNPAYPSYLQKNGAGDWVAYIPLYITGTENYTKAYEVLDSVNAERKKRGLSALTMDKDLLVAAMQRASELPVRYSHDRPSGESCFTVSPKAVAENIAAYQTTAASVMGSWMNSDGHRGNILGSNYKSIGIGCYVHEGRYYWVQLFGNESATKVTKPANKTAEHSIGLMAGSSWQPSLSMRLVSGSEALGTTASYEVWSYDSESWSSAKILPKSFNWTSSSTAVATINASGKASFVGAGKTTLKATVKGHTIFASTSCNIAKLKITNAAITAPATQLATGKALTPKPSVSYGGKKLVEGTDYTLSYANNVKHGKATITITGKGNYTGTTTVSFKIMNESEPVYWLVHKTKGENLYTTDTNEVKVLSKGNWTNKGIVWYTSWKGDPVYRLYHPGINDHHYTSDLNEVKVLTTKSSWRVDSGDAMWYSSGSVRTYRLFSPSRNSSRKPGTHRFATSQTEVNNLKKSGWQLDGVKMYGIKLK